MENNGQYLIDVPPPTISGKLHLGHLFSYTQMDAVARFQKLKGKDVLYPFCYDNNGLPTEKLAKEANITDFRETIKYSDRVSDEYEALFRSIGMDFDYTHFYSTISSKAADLTKKAFVALRSAGLIYKSQKEVFFCPKTQCSVSQSEIDDEGRFERSGAKVETKVMDCWFVRVLDKIGDIRWMIHQIEWHPEHYKQRLLKWLEGYKYDWCISRQRRYGIEIPGEKDVFDTWFTSSLSPQLAWMSRTGEVSLKCPVFNARFQAHDIINTWALYTIIQSIYHNHQMPWKKIIVSGHALTGEGGKMSKSKGQNIPPRELVMRYGPEAVRYWAYHSQPGSDAQVDYTLMEKGRKLLNKIKNAKRFLDMNPNDGENAEFRKQWLSTRDYMDIQMEISSNWAYTLGHLVAFFWNSFCDKFIEESKKTPANRTLQAIFDEMLDYFEIFMPNIRKLSEPTT